MVDVETFLALATQAIEGQTKIFGPVFPRLAAQNWVRFVADKIGETPPNVESLEQAIDYVKAKTEKYPKAYTGVAYGICKTTATLEGHIGVGTTSIMTTTMTQREWTGELLNNFGEVSGTTDALNRLVGFLEMMSIYPAGMVVGSGNGVDSTVRLNNCEFAEACDRLMKEGVGRKSGESDCYIGLSVTPGVEMVTGKHHDYKNVKMAPPNCEIKIYQTE